MTAFADWAPTVDDVGALLRARTKDRHGNELGTFTDDTRPTQYQVESIIERVAQDIDDSVDAPLPQRLYGSARRLGTYMAACEVELGYFPEQVSTNRSPYAQLAAVVTERRSALVKAWTADTGGRGDEGGGGTGAVVSDPAAAPSGGFPGATVRYLDEGVTRAPGAEYPRPFAPPLLW